jgi:dsDNA-specific endonuclease/ATPase MutS2
MLPPAPSGSGAADALASRHLLDETRAALALELDLSCTVDFGGMPTSSAEAAVRRASKGGAATGPQLRALVQTMQGALRIRRQVATVVRQQRLLADGDEDEEEAFFGESGGSSSRSSRRRRKGPLSAAAQRKADDRRRRLALLSPIADGVASRLCPPEDLLREISAALDEEGNVVDNASERLRTSRQRVKQLTARLTAAMKPYPGEPSERGGRVCVAVPEAGLGAVSGAEGGSSPAARRLAATGVLLGSAPGLRFIEPASAVQANNDLGAARAEADAAEEDVLWRLSGLLMGRLAEAEGALEGVAWLDEVCARARFGAAIGGVVPELVGWDEAFRARALARRAVAGGGGGGGGNGSNDASDATMLIELRGLRHPLLYADYLARRGELEREVRAEEAEARRRGRQERHRLERRLRKKGSGAAARRLGGLGGDDDDDSDDPVSADDAAARWLRGEDLAEGATDDEEDEGEEQDGAAAALLPSPPASDDASSPPQEEEQQLSAFERLQLLSPPRPIDLLVPAAVSAVVVTGPNTGGKTAAMKALGLAAAMASAGVPLPAAGSPARLPRFSAVLADIGDEQSLTASLSTFSGHLRRIMSLRAEADGRALLLLDELGTGTDPAEGAALGKALLRRLARGGHGCGALTFATTHHSSMTALKFEPPVAAQGTVVGAAPADEMAEDEEPEGAGGDDNAAAAEAAPTTPVAAAGRFENASVEFDEARMAPTYRLLWGVPGRSNALNIAARLGLDADVVDDARRRLGASGLAAANAAFARLEAVRLEAEREAAAGWAVEQELAAARSRVADLRRAVRARQQQLARQREQGAWRVYAAARDVLRRVRQERKQRSAGTSGGDKTETSRRLDAALGEGEAAAAAAFRAWSEASAAAEALQGAQPRPSSSSSSADEPAWVAEWASVVEGARATLAAAGGASADDAAALRPAGAAAASAASGGYLTLADEEALSQEVAALDAAEREEALREAAARRAAEAGLSAWRSPVAGGAAAAKTLSLGDGGDVAADGSDLDAFDRRLAAGAAIDAIERALDGSDDADAALLFAAGGVAEEEEGEAALAAAADAADAPPPAAAALTPDALADIESIEALEGAALDAGLLDDIAMLELELDGGGGAAPPAAPPASAPAAAAAAAPPSSSPPPPAASAAPAPAADLAAADELEQLISALEDF